ncbi:enoyl reductase [Colletotrichum incanum]|nr:enoyl reductase [Colletotrichum incanum]
MALQTNQFSPPSTQKALVMNEKEQLFVWDEAPCPVLPPDQALVRIEAVALNPSNTKMKTDFANPFAIMGADFAGTVVAVGPDVVGVAVGDRVCGAQNEMFKATPEQGAFAQYTVTRGKMWMRVPESWTMEAAASLPVGLCTAGLAIKSLGLPLPNELVAKAKHVLVYGSSTATATIAMQLLRLAGLIPIAVCSQKHFALSRKNGALEVFDRFDKDVAQKIVNSSCCSLSHCTQTDPGG